MLRRLRKEYESYQKETKTIEAKIAKYEEQISANQNNEDVELHIRKNVTAP
jgi:hypothetical protein